MKLYMNTNFLHLIEPGTYGTMLGDYMNDIRDECIDDWLNAMVEHGIAKINEILSEEFIVDRFGVLKAENGKMYRPQFYNYENDSIEFDLIVPDETVEQIRSAEYDEEFFSWAKENFGSRSGFISFMPYTKEKFDRAIMRNDLDLSRAVSMLIMKTIEDNTEESEIEEWQEDYQWDVIDELSNHDWEIYDEEDE